MPEQTALNDLPLSAPVAPLQVPPAPPAISARIVSLDALRGFDMFWIIGGGEFVKGLAKALDTPLLNAFLPQLQHVDWQGLHCWDVIWPLFMFIVGVSIPFSIAGRRAAGAGDRSLLLHAVRRSVILFCLGMVLQGRLLDWDLSVFRPCYSVLHGIAAGYLIATIVALKSSPRMQAVITVAFLLYYWAVMMLAPVPRVGSGVLLPGKNFATWVDRLVLGRFHFGENTWFVTYPAFASSIMLGVLAGHLLRSERQPRIKCALLAAAGVVCLAVGLLLSLAFPIIKLLWTSSFVLVCGGLSFLALAAFYGMIDVLGWRRWAFAFAVIGMNSIAVYFGTMLFDFRRIGNIFVGSLLPRVGPWNAALESGAALIIVWLVLYWMYRTKTFVKV
jgi:predicted acyltransferase